MFSKIILIECCLLLLSAPICRSRDNGDGKPSVHKIPQQLSVSGSGAFGTGYSIDLKFGKMIYTKGVGGNRLVERSLNWPSDKQWREFRETLDKLKIWTWRVRYHPRVSDGEIYDGERWLIKIDYNDRKISSRGEGVYPADKDPTQVEPGFKKSRRFDEFERALMRLTGLPSLYD